MAKGIKDISINKFVIYLLLVKSGNNSYYKYYLYFQHNFNLTSKSVLPVLIRHRCSENSIFINFMLLEWDSEYFNNVSHIFIDYYDGRFFQLKYSNQFLLLILIKWNVTLGNIRLSCELWQRTWDDFFPFWFIC